MFRMTQAEWADIFVRLVDVIVWPTTLLVALVLLRRHVPLVGRWFSEIVTRRGFAASAPGVSLRVDPPTAQELLDADLAAAEELAESIPSSVRGSDLQELQQRVTEAARVIHELSEAWKTAAAESEDAVAQRIASRFERYWKAASSDLERSASALDFSVGGDVQIGSFVGSRQTRVLLMLAFLKRAHWGQDLEAADLDDWIRAAELLRDRDHDVTVPPFTAEDLALARRATSVHLPQAIEE